MFRRLFQTTRSFSAAAHGFQNVHSKGGHPKQSFQGFVAPKVSREHKVVSEIFMFYAWFWLFYRFREHGGVLLGLWHPWDAVHDDDDEHDESHGDHGHHH